MIWLFPRRLFARLFIWRLLNYQVVVTTSYNRCRPVSFQRLQQAILRNLPPANHHIPYKVCPKTLASISCCKLQKIPYNYTSSCMRKKKLQGAELAYPTLWKRWVPHHRLRSGFWDGILLMAEIRHHLGWSENPS